MSDRFLVASFYEFTSLNDPGVVANEVKKFCTQQKIQGSVIIATEGVNGTVAGQPEHIENFITHLRDSDFPNLNCKVALTDVMPFYRMKVRIKPEIISMFDAPIDPTEDRGALIAPDQWNEFISQQNVLLIDVRNSYETNIGTFRNSVKPDTASFREFKEYIDSKLINYKDKKIAMFCTGGIRCEKASHYMKEMGFSEVFQLEGGILKYLEVGPEHDSEWEGECFVFDNRVSVTHGLEKGDYELCHGCRMPISPAEIERAEYEEEVTCAHCFYDSSEEKKNGARERSRQIKQAKRLGIPSTFIPGSFQDYS